MDPAVAASCCTTSTPVATVASTIALTTSTLATTTATSTESTSVRASELSATETTTVRDAPLQVTSTDEPTAAASNRAALPPLAIDCSSSSDRTALYAQSDSSVHSSESVSSSSSSSSSSSEYGDEFDESEDDSQSSSSPSRFLLKPMPTLLPVCPMDDLAVEDEKRRRRHSRNSNLGSPNSNPNSSKAKHKKRVCADTECLPTPHSPLVVHTSSSADAPPATATTNRMAAAPQLLRRDSMAIRHKYWKQLGLTVTRSDLERSSGRRRIRHKGLKVQLNDAPSARGASKSIFQLLASWYGTSEKDESPEAATVTPTDSDSPTASTSSSPSSSSSSDASPPAVAPMRRSIRFSDEAELFYIPLHTDYSKRQRDGMWHTRVEFVAMVERNLEAVYDELEREFDAQCALEARETDAMMAEEATQRKVAAMQQQQQQQQKRDAAIQKAAITVGSSSSSGPVSAATVPTLSLCPIETQIKLAPRGRSPHDIRFKYLKHLGINNKNR